MLIKKQLGQYFSGDKVAELLVSLCNLTGNETVIDPMLGVGDMLDAVIKSGVQKENVYGIEIDKNAAIIGNEKLQSDKIIVGDAFSLTSYKTFDRTSWDVVITNPPYVRYQTMSENFNSEIKLKNATEVRNGLKKIVDSLCHLTPNEKKCFQRIINNYSGLSDLAVPSWIMCAALVNQGGTLAMVVPESWLNRNYAITIKYLLLKFFNIHFIVEDLNATWFSNAQIKTNLIVAQRTAIQSEPLSRKNEEYSHLRLSSKTIGESSLVENLEYIGLKGQEALKSVVISKTDAIGDGFELKRIGTSDFISNMANTQGFRKIIHELEPEYSFEHMNVLFPKDIQDAIGLNNQSETVDITAWGFNVGQGLRTGANKFFYTELIGVDNDFDILNPDKELNKSPINVSQKYSIPSLRYQSDSESRFFVSKNMISHRLLYISESFYNFNGEVANVADTHLAEYIESIENCKMKINGKSTNFSELSAVKPNTRKVIVDGKPLQRYWFMLPQLANRHLPQLCIARVNYKSPRCLMVENGVVVDANFSTLWTGDLNEQQIYAMFAILNSSWTQAYFECIASVMGGGALKVEATHLRQIRLPTPTSDLVSSLSCLGKQLTKNNSHENESVLLSIDNLVLGALYNVVDLNKYTNNLRELIHSKLESRSK